MIILLGLQIFRVANQLINSTVTPVGGGDLALHSFPVPLFDDFMLNYNTLSSAKNKNRVSNETFLDKKFAANNNFNEFSKRSGFFEPSINQSIPFDSQIPEYSRPYPYSRGLTDSVSNAYTSPESVVADRKFSSYNIKPDWNGFEDSIDQSLNEPNSYYDTTPQHTTQLKNDEKRDEENTSPTDDSFDSDYNESEYPPDLDTNDGYDEEEEEEENPDIGSYKEEDTPECAFGHNYCFLDDQYPEASMRRAVDKQMDILTQMLPESSDTFDLVEGIPKEIDENYTYIDSPHDLYNSESSDRMTFENANELNYRDGGYICPSYVNYIKPKRAQNNDGLWKVILNLNESYRGVDYNQNIRIEECVYERTKCSFAPNYYKSECIQKYSNERLIAWTPDKGIHLDVFRLPIACSCHLTSNDK